MADITDEPRQRALVEHLRHLPHGTRQMQPLAVGRCDAGTLLPAMLQSVEPETRQGRRLGCP